MVSPLKRFANTEGIEHVGLKYGTNSILGDLYEENYQFMAVFRVDAEGKPVMVSPFTGAQYSIGTPIIDPGEEALYEVVGSPRRVYNFVVENNLNFRDFVPCNVYVPVILGETEDYFVDSNCVGVSRGVVGSPTFWGDKGILDYLNSPDTALAFLSDLGFRLRDHTLERVVNLISQDAMTSFWAVLQRPFGLILDETKLVDAVLNDPQASYLAKNHWPECLVKKYGGRLEKSISRFSFWAGQERWDHCDKAKFMERAEEIQAKVRASTEKYNRRHIDKFKTIRELREENK